VSINRLEQRQTIIGFGGAFTEASAVNFQKLTPAAQKKVLEAYWGADGIGYTLGRVPINSCDFSLASYNFDDVDGDWELKYFDTGLAHDWSNGMIPLIRAAMATARDSGSPYPMKLFGSPWSPPGWLKYPQDPATNPGGKHSMTGSHKPNGLIASEVGKATWALYMSKWVSAYEAALAGDSDFDDFKFWGITVQNEPEFAAAWEACKYNASAEAAFVREYLGPTLRRDHPDLKIMAFDHNKDHLEAWTTEMYADHSGHSYINGEGIDGLGAGGFVDGMAFHWYAGGLDRLMDGTYGYHFVSAAHQLLPDPSTNFLLASEGCNCPGTATPGTVEAWVRAERYAHDILHDLNNYASGWVDWNLLLDSKGGPNHLGNVCDAPIVCHEDHNGVILQPYLEVIGHFSKFLVPGSTVVFSSVTADFQGLPDAGGGSKVVSGTTLATWPCDSSIRQSFLLMDDGRLLLNDNQDSSGEAPVELCVSSASQDVAGGSAQVLDCVLGHDWVGRFAFEHERLVLKGTLKESTHGFEEKCLGTSPEYGPLMAQGGGPIYLQDCIATDSGTDYTHQLWHADSNSNSYKTMSSSASQEQCLTAGWPFVQAVVGVTPDGDSAVVVFNEAAVEVEVSMAFEDGQIVYGSVPAESIQTYLLPDIIVL
jgi:glucosylceramidase